MRLQENTPVQNNPFWIDLQRSSYCSTIALAVYPLPARAPICDSVSASGLLSSIYL